MRIREIRYWGGRGQDAALAATMLKRMPETRPKVRYGVYRISRVPSGRCCGTSPRLMEYGKDTGWTVSSIPEANCILGGASSGLVYGPPKAFRSAQRFQFHIPSFLWRPRSARQRC